MSEKKKRRKLLITVSSTPDRERQIRALLILRGYSEAEIKTIMAKPVTTVKSGLEGS